jgi:hypothetical protein
MKIQMPVKLPPLSMRHQLLLDPIDRELPRRLSRIVLPEFGPILEAEVGSVETAQTGRRH